MTNKFSIFFVFFFAILIAISSFYLKIAVEKELITKDKKITNAPNIFVKDFKAKKTNKEGKLVYIFYGDEMLSYEFNETATVKKPKFIQYENNKAHSKISGEEAYIKDKGNKIIFSNNVLLTRFADKNKKELNLYTNELNIFPENEYVFSNLPVKIIQEPNIEIDGVGMNYDKNKNIFNLLDKVKVHYDKPKK